MAPDGAPSRQPTSRARRDALITHLREAGGADVASLARAFGVSVETIRRDLRHLEAGGRVIRSHGRAVPAESAAFETDQGFRSRHLADEKERIAAAAAALLGDAETVFLDEGNQPLLVGRALPADRDLTIVTTSLPTAVELAAGLADGALGTDPGLIVSVVEQLAARCTGVLVLADLGSGIMSAEMALEMLDPALAERTRLSAAPFIEGLLGAYGAAGIGKDLQAVATEADGAAEAKRSQVTAF